MFVFGSPEAQEVLIADRALQEQIAKAHNELATIDDKIEIHRIEVDELADVLLGLQTSRSLIEDELALAKKGDSEEEVNALQKELDDIDDEISDAKTSHRYAKDRYDEARSRKTHLKKVIQ